MNQNRTKMTTIGRNWPAKSIGEGAAGSAKTGFARADATVAKVAKRGLMGTGLRQKGERW
jgi:hypothetical protein